MTLGRAALADGQPPAYLFPSPCCDAPALVAAWIVEYAVARTEGRLLLECGRFTADPLRSVSAVRGRGCGEQYIVGLDRDAIGRGALPQGQPRPVDAVRPRRIPGPASG